MNKKEMFERLARDIILDSMKKVYGINTSTEKQLDFATEISDRLYRIFEGSVRVKEMEQWLMVPAIPEDIGK